MNTPKPPRPIVAGDRVRLISTTGIADLSKMRGGLLVSIDGDTGYVRLDDDPSQSAGTPFPLVDLEREWTGDDE